MTGIPLFRERPQGSQTGNVGNLLSSHVITKQGTPGVGIPGKGHPPSGGRGGESHTPGTLLPTPSMTQRGGGRAQRGRRGPPIHRAFDTHRLSAEIPSTKYQVLSSSPQDASGGACFPPGHRLRCVRSDIDSACDAVFVRVGNPRCWKTTDQEVLPSRSQGSTNESE
jgi:hypothetical protein